MITEKILRWYRQNKRILPWRQTNDPYKIWLSEIILQQTRIDQGIDYYLRFVDKYQDVFALAKASEDEVLKLWQGLGYYSRARNLHCAAKQVVKEFGGVLPSSKKELLTLKGIGDYTASAIASIAFGEAVPVVDGNVLRFVSRLFAIEDPIDTVKGKNTVEEIMFQLISKDNPGDFNQAVMEFGAVYCVPKSPDCECCVFIEECLAVKKDMVKILPIKRGKVKQRTRYFYYLIIEDDEHNILIQKRTNDDIWKGLFEFPLIESKDEMSAKDVIEQSDLSSLFGENFKLIHESTKFNHQLSHQKILTSFFKIKTNKATVPKKYIQIKKKDFDDYPVSRLISRYVEHFGLS